MPILSTREGSWGLGLKIIFYTPLTLFEKLNYLFCFQSKLRYTVAWLCLFYVADHLAKRQFLGLNFEIAHTFFGKIKTKWFVNWLVKKPTAGVRHWPNTVLYNNTIYCTFTCVLIYLPSQQSSGSRPRWKPQWADVQRVLYPKNVTWVLAAILKYHPHVASCCKFTFELDIPATVLRNNL